MDDVLSALEDVSLEETKETKKEFESQEPASEMDLSRVDYKNLKSLLATTQLYAVKNVGSEDLLCDWDLTLMPEELKGEFDEYLSQRYNVYQIKESNLDFRIVVLYRDGRSINFLHQFMTEKKIPILESVQEGPESVMKSQFALPAGETAIVTATQYESLKKYEKRRAVVDSGQSDWFGTLVFKQVDEDNMKKVNHSFVTVSDIKNNGFEVSAPQLQTKKGSARMEYSDELDNL